MTSEDSSARMTRRTFLGKSAATGAAVAATLGAPDARAAVPVPDAPSALTTDAAVNPLGIDTAKPQLAWQITAPRDGLLQSAYEIHVASSVALLTTAPDVWTSGKVTSGDSAGVAYRGPALTSRRRYYWRVRIWDDQGGVSPWSTAAWWEAGLLQASDWTAQWIGPDVSDAVTFGGAKWIWYPEGDPASGLPAMTRYFRAPVTIPAGAEVHRARLIVTADDSWSVYVNGAHVADSPSGALWNDAQALDVTSSLEAGSNVLAVAATNASTSPAGLLAKLVVDYAAGGSGGQVVVSSGASWRASQTAPSGWVSKGHDDSGWASARELAAYGGGPWGNGVMLPPRPAPLLRTEFRVSKTVRSARLYIAGIGLHELELNGSRVGDHVLDPATTDYDVRVLYVTHDVTGLVRSGTNAVGVELGRGFYAMTTSTAWDWTSASWRDGEPRLRLQLEITFADGTKQTIGSSTTWQAADGPTRSDSLYAGETYDARLAKPGWSTAGGAGSGWRQVVAVAAPKGRLVAQYLDPIKILAGHPVVGSTTPAPGVRVFDFGRTLGGWVQLTASGAAGTKVTMKYAQQLTADGRANLEQGYVHGGRFQTDEYVLAGGGTETWRPRFSHKSFRYVEVTGLPAGGRLQGHEVRTAASSGATFSSSSDLYNRIHSMVVRSQGNHMLGIPAVDVMYEKIGWTADAQLNMPSLATNYAAHNFYAKWLDDLADSQSQDGSIPFIVPSGGWGYGGHAPEWTAAYPIVLWELYLRFGDVRALTDHYAGVKRYVESVYASRDGEGLAPTDLGDWLAPGGYTQPPEDRRLTATAYLYRALRILVDAATALGKTPDATGYRKSATELRDVFNAKFLDRTAGNYRTANDPGYRQTSNAVPLVFGLVPDDLRARVAAGLAADVIARRNHLDTGAIGTAVLLPALCRNGYPALAHTVAGQTSFPSWGYWLANGADTLWETWELVQNGQGRPPGHDHYLFGSIDSWFYEQVAGITPTEPGYRRVRIAPCTDGPLSSASAGVDTVRGRINAGWTKSGDTVTVTVDVPGNCIADVVVGGVTHTVGSGHHRFTG